MISIALPLLLFTISSFLQVKKSRDELEKANAKDEAMLDSIGEGVIATDENSKIIKINRTAEKMLGFTRSELFERWIVGAFAVYDESGNPLNPSHHPMIEAMTTGKQINITLQFARKDFTKFVAGVCVSPILFNQKPIGAIVVFRDVTKEHEIDRMKTEFISLASHQLRTPLSAMKWNLESLLSGKEKFTADQKEFLSEINKSNERMIELVNSLLNISRIESGRIIVYRQTTSVTL